MLFDNSRVVYISVDKKFNILSSDIFTDNLENYMLPLLRQDFISRVKNIEGNLIIFMVFLIDGEEYPTNVLVKRTEDGYDLAIYDTGIDTNHNRKQYIGYLEYDFKNSFILSFHFKGQDKKLMESLDYFAEANDDGIMIYAEHITSYISFARDIVSEKRKIFQVYVEGNLRWVLFEMTGINIDISHICYVAMVDVTDEINSQIAIIKKTFRDPLTDSLQKDSITQYITDYLTIYKNNPAMIAMVDIDYFKQINDTYGHSFGDLVLSKVCQSFKKNLSKYNGAQIGRFGGDEFLLFVPGISDYMETKELCAKIRAEIGKIHFPELKSFSLSCTNGITRYPLDGNCLDVLIKKADKALYRGKLKGRDCYIIYDQEKCGGINEGDTNLDLKEISKLLALKKERPDLVCKITSELILNPNCKEAIPKALDDFRVSYGLERLVFMYKINDTVKSYVSTTKEYKIPEDYTIESIDKYSEYFENNHLRLNNSSSIKFKNVFLQQMLLRFKIAALDMYRLVDDKGEMVGLLSFEMCSIKRTWVQNELQAFAYLREYLITYINKYVK